MDGVAVVADGRWVVVKNRLLAREVLGVQQAFGISEIRVQDALNPTPEVPAQRAAADATQTLTDAPPPAVALR